MSEASADFHPKIFISYSHDGDGHRERVLALAQRLRQDGFETILDRYVQGSPPQGWPRWMLNQIDWADFILLVCTETYYRRFRGQDMPGVGKGVDWEGAIITNELYGQKSVSARFVPVVFEAADTRFIPEPLAAFTHYFLANESRYGELTRYLAGGAGIDPLPLGPSPHAIRERSAPLTFGENRPFHFGPSGASSGASGVIPDLTALPAPGGALSADSAYYIERGADLRAKAASTLRCETIIIQGPRQFGKSSLVTRYLAMCRARGKTVASVNFSMFEEAIISDYGRFLTLLASELARRLRLSPPGVESMSQHSFLLFLETALLPALPGPVIFAFVETDRIMRQKYAADFFSMVRMWHNERADPDLVWHKVGLALASSSEPKLFIKDPQRSPFNVGQRLPLEPFTESQAASLNQRYGGPLSASEFLELHRLVGGHPFLTQDAYYKLYGPDPIDFGELTRTAAHDDGPFGDHLRAMLDNLLAADGLLATLRQVISHGTVPQLNDFYRLEGAGLVRREGPRIVPSNQIYADFFRSTV